MDQPAVRTQIMLSTMGSTQEEGAETSKSTIALPAAARRIGAGLLMTIAARINPQTSTHAMNKLRRISVSNFMSVSPFEGRNHKVPAVTGAIPVPALLARATN